MSLEDLDLSNFDFDAELAKLTNRERPSFSGDPTPEEWERVNTYRWNVETFYKSLDPDDLAVHDQLVAFYKPQLEDLGLDIYSLRGLHTITLAQGINQFFVNQSARTCGAGPIMAAHVMEHYVEGTLRFDYVLRQALIEAGAPAPHAPEATAPSGE